jgi:hypothetical protein
MEQTGAQEPSPVPGKMMNCGAYATYEPSDSSEECAAMCHGGRYNQDTYRPCPVRAECRQETINRKYRRLPVLQEQQTLITPPPKPTEPPAVNPFLMPPFRMPSLGGMPTQNPQAKPQEPSISPTQRAQAEAAYRAREGQFPGATIPAENAPRGMRTPYAAVTSAYGEISPTFLPGENENIIDRLLKNILQGILAVIGWHLFNFARSVDLFG